MEDKHLPTSTTQREQYVFTADNILRLNNKELPCILDKVVQQIGLAALGGSSDCGKSSILRHFAIAICTKQKKFLGCRIKAKHNSVIYVSTEDDIQSVSYLLNKQNGEQKIPPNLYQSLRYIFDTEDILEKLEAELSNKPADLVIVDTFTDLYIGSMNDTNQVRSYLNKYNLLAQRHKCLILFLHHTGKKTELLAPSKNNLLGSQGFEAKMRVVFELRRDKYDSSLRHLCIVKGNYLKDDYKSSSFVLKFSENMTFSNTGVRVPFEELKQDDKNDDEKKKREEQQKREAKKLRSQGLTQQAIGTKLGVNKSTISRWLNE